jgi:hypothetical protein
LRETPRRPEFTLVTSAFEAIVMVCAKCQRLAKSTTTLATPAVKKRSEIYYGSPASSSRPDGVRRPATLGQTGVTKSKLLSKVAKNPYAQYSR